MKIIIVGGGSAGWMTAAHLATFNKECEITLIESKKIPIIGVGESVTPHVSAFFRDLNVPMHTWMRETGGIIKLGNKFVNWVENKGEGEHFSFTFTIPSENYYKDVAHPTTVRDFRPRKFHRETRSIDHIAKLYKDGEIDRYDQYAHSQYHYMAKNKYPFHKGQYLLNQPWGITHHINAELIGKFLRDHIALPNGVQHITSTVAEVTVDGDVVKELTLENGEKIVGDVFVDATGFHRLLVNKLGWKQHTYDYPINRAWVVQTDYENPAEEMANYTQSIAEDFGWRFKISLYHRMGNGYCFGDKYISDEEALEYFKKSLGPNKRRFEPKLIKWTPNRLEQFAKGNVISIGLSSGFVEPMESNLLYITVFAIRSLSKILRGKKLDWDTFNKEMIYSFDDVYEFLLAHYTLTQREDTPFWRDLKMRGIKENHVQMAIDKTRDRRNSVFNSLAGRNLFPDYMWMELVTTWGHNPNIVAPKNLHELAKLHILSYERKHNLISEEMDNSFEWLKDNVFQGLGPREWEEKYLDKR